MLKSTLTAGALALVLFNLSPSASASDLAKAADLEPSINGGVSETGLFPNQDMEDAFASYLGWTKDNGLSRLAAFEAVERDFDGAVSGEGSSSGRFPTQAMEEQFKDYLAWTGSADEELFYAFRVTDFD